MHVSSLCSPSCAHLQSHAQCDAFLVSLIFFYSTTMEKSKGKQVFEIRFCLSFVLFADVSFLFSCSWFLREKSQNLAHLTVVNIFFVEEENRALFGI